MSYRSIVDMALSASLRDRLRACAAEQGEASPEVWVGQHMWALAASPGWATKWDSAKVGLTIDQNPDLGARDDVITDADVLAAVQALRA